MSKPTKTERLKNRAFHRIRANEPARVAETRAKRGDAAAEAQIRAIALDEVRRRGARIGKPKP
mgnify:CR=1 FL=1